MNRNANSYAWCKRICKESNSSFVPAFGLVDSDRRNAMYALYAFARISDDLADGTARDTAEQDSPAARKHKYSLITSWRSELSAALELPQQTNVVAEREAKPSGNELANYSELWPALSHCVQRYRIPSEHLFEIVDGVAMDISPQQPDDWQGLEDYCYLVASAVGLACTYIWKASEKLNHQAAVDCGLAFQLTNILRDVSEDAQQARIYLPKSLFRKYGIDEKSWLALNPSGDWRSLMNEVAERAALLYDSGWRTITDLEPNSQRMFSLMWRGYRDLLDIVQSEIELTWQRRKKASLRLHRKLSLLGSHYVGPLYKSLPCPVEQKS